MHEIYPKNSNVQCFIKCRGTQADAGSRVFRNGVGVAILYLLFIKQERAFIIPESTHNKLSFAI